VEVKITKSPYPGYFARRDPPRPVDYEEAYWGEIVDPYGC